MSVNEEQHRVVHGSLGRHHFVLDAYQGHLMVDHEGDITWDELQAIKTHVWGAEARAIEVYPAESNLINNACMRHLWLLGPYDFCPDLAGGDGHESSLAARHAVAWAEARK